MKVQHYFQLQSGKNTSMTQSTKQKGIMEEALQYVKNNKALLLGVGVSLTVLGIAVKLVSQRIHPDMRKVLQLRSTIEKSYPLALHSLETLNIEKRILTEYAKEGSNLGPQLQQLNMLYLVITRLKLKQSNKQKELRNPFLPPFEEGLFISQLQPSHRLLYNKFNIFKNHLLVVTKQFEAQSNELNEMDFRQSILVLKALNGLMFYNSGPESGSSQPHKHIQVFPLDALQLPIVQKITEYIKIKSKTYDFEGQPIIEFPGFNFIHGLVILKPQTSLSASKKQMHSGYKRLLEERFYRVKAVAYNMVATEQFILIVARSKQKAFGEISVNSVGFMGSLLFKDQQKLNKYMNLKIRPQSILEDITYPKDYVPVNEEKGQSEEALSSSS